MSSGKFSVTGLSFSGEWDEAGKMVVMRQLDGSASISGSILGMNLNVEGVLDVAMDNRIRFKATSAGKLPAALIPVALKSMLKGSLAKAVQFQGDTAWFDPNVLLPEERGFRVLMQPGTFEMPDNAEVTIRERIMRWARENGGKVGEEVASLVLTIPDLMGLLIALIRDDRVSLKSKGKLALAISYVLLPVDLIPDFVPALGLVDDAAAIFLAVTSALADTPPEVFKAHWKGREDVLDLILKGQALSTVLDKLSKPLVTALFALFGIQQSEVKAS